MDKLAKITVFSFLIVVACSGPAKKPREVVKIPPLSRKDAGVLLSSAKAHIGEPYRMGGLSTRGWDCSGFVHVMYGKYLSISLPRDTRGQYAESVPVRNSRVRPGDLVFFNIKSSKPSHVGIFMGRDRFIHASMSSGVIISSLHEKYYRRTFAGFRRPLTLRSLSSR
jgi:peptidoglycan endopeptidase LytE